MTTNTTTITATELKTHSGELLKRAHQNGEHFAVKRAGYLVAVLMPIYDYEAQVQADQDNASERS